MVRDRGTGWESLATSDSICLVDRTDSRQRSARASGDEAGTLRMPAPHNKAMKLTRLAAAPGSAVKVSPRGPRARSRGNRPAAYRQC